MAAPKKRRSLMKIRKRRAGIFAKLKQKLVSLNNIVICKICNNPRISHKYCCFAKK